LPYGLGRAIRSDRKEFFDGQFKDGVFHGYIVNIGLDTKHYIYNFDHGILDG